MTPIRNARLRLSQGQLFWREGGRGQTLVFLHGAWRDGNQWRSWMDDLSSHYHCIAPDLLGFGESERPKLHYSIELEVECLAELLETLRLRQVCLVGDSIGAWIAASYALRFPEQVQAIVLLNPAGVLPKSGWQMTPLSHRFPAIGKLLRSIAKLLKRSDWLHQQQQFAESPVGATLLYGRRSREAEALRDRLAWLKLPVLLLQGDQDSDKVKITCETIARAAPSVEVQICVGSDGNLNEPEAIAAIDRFLQQLT